MAKTIFYILSVIVNIVYFIVMRIDLFTDHYRLPDDVMRERQRSAMDSLYHADMNWLFYLEILIMAVSIISGVLMLFGVKNNIVKIVQIVSTIASTAVFIIIMITAGNIHLHY